MIGRGYDVRILLLLIFLRVSEAGVSTCHSS